MRTFWLIVIIVLGLFLFVGQTYPIPEGAPYHLEYITDDEGQIHEWRVGTKDYSQVPIIIRAFSRYGMIPLVIECFLIFGWISGRDEFQSPRQGDADPNMHVSPPPLLERLKQLASIK